MKRPRKVQLKTTDEDRPPPAANEEAVDRESDDLDAQLRPDPTTPRDYVGPPLHGKTDPPEAMDDAKPTLDDEHRNFHHHPSDAGTTEFAFDPLAGDAAADLAGDLGSQFLDGATRGEDMSAVAMDADDASEEPLDFLIDDLGGEDDTDAGNDENEEPPSEVPPGGRRRSR